MAERGHGTQLQSCIIFSSKNFIFEFGLKSMRLRGALFQTQGVGPVSDAGCQPCFRRRVSALFQTQGVSLVSDAGCRPCLRRRVSAPFQTQGVSPVSDAGCRPCFRRRVSAPFQTQGVRRRRGRGSGGAPRPSTLSGRPAVEHNPQRRSVSGQQHVCCPEWGISLSE